jgi:hypothetical protein
MKELLKFEKIYFKISVVFICITTFFLPYNNAVYNATSSEKGFGYPIAYVCFPTGQITSSLFHSVGINILALYLDYMIFYIIVKIIGKLIVRVFAVGLSILHKNKIL